MYYSTSTYCTTFFSFSLYILSSSTTQFLFSSFSPPLALLNLLFYNLPFFSFFIMQKISPFFYPSSVLNLSVIYVSITILCFCIYVSFSFFFLFLVYSFRSVPFFQTFPSCLRVQCICCSFFLTTLTSFPFLIF